MINELYRRFVRPSLFKKSQSDPEIAHEIVAGYMRRLGHYNPLCSVAGWWNRISSGPLVQQIRDVVFPNPIGLAAGFDKNAEFLRALIACGFGFLEVGSVLPFYQQGNERPRTVRQIEDKALLNRMGFNSEGVVVVEDNLRVAGRLPIPVGINLGKMKETPNHAAAEDYAWVLERLYAYGDYFVINVSSPNTPGLRELQHNLAPLLGTIIDRLNRLAKEQGGNKPIGVKLAPDLTNAQLDSALQAILGHKMDFVILGNTQKVSRLDLDWGRSGAPLFPRTKEMVAYVCQRTEGELPIIACGGIDSADKAYEVLEAGASLIQVLTGLVYEGPLLPKEMAKGIKRKLQRAGNKQLSDLLPYTAIPTPIRRKA